MKASLDRALTAFTAWVIADAVGKIAGLVIVIGAGVYILVATARMAWQMRMIGGF